MRRILTAGVASWIFAACTPGPRVPTLRPGDAQIPQLFVLSDTHSAITKFWGFPPRDALIGQIDAHVEWDAATSLDDAKEKLQVWGGRPADLIVLGPGVPVQAFKALKLPKVAKRKILLLGEAAAVPDAVAADVAGAPIEAFVAEFCKLKLSIGACPKGRLVSVGDERDTSPDGDPLALNVVVRWKDFLKQVLYDKNPTPPVVRRLDFFSGDVEARRGPALRSKEDTATFEKMKHEFMLNELSKRGAP